MRSLFEQLGREMDKALPKLPAHEGRQLLSLHGRIAPLLGPRGALGHRDDPFSLAARAELLRGLVHDSQDRVRQAGSAPPPEAAGSVPTRLLAALQALKLAVGDQGLAPGGGQASFKVATDLFKRLGRLSHGLGSAPPTAEALALIERDEARPLAAQVIDFLRAGHLCEAHPVWSRQAPARDTSAVFYSGRDGVGWILQAAAKAHGLAVEPVPASGHDPTAQRWRSLRRAGLAVFDLSDAAPRVYYELGMALAAGSQLLLTAPEGTVLPFDVAQQVLRYDGSEALLGLLQRALPAAFYEVQTQGPRLVDGVDPLLLRTRAHDTLGRHAADRGAWLLPRWRPQPTATAPRRWFAVMPFRAAPTKQWQRLRQRFASAQPQALAVRGDEAEGQEIIESIWDELCRASWVTADLSGLNPNVCLEVGIAHTLGRRTLLIGEPGTAQRLAQELPGLAKWRCHEYGRAGSPGFQRTVDEFFAVP